MTTALLQTTYFGPIQWYQKLNSYDSCLIEQYDSYQKQTYRNRCIISTANGLQALSVPVSCDVAAKGDKCLTKDVRISDHNQWRRIHWNALQSAYSESPYFDYYADDLHPFFEQRYEYLVDFNEAIRQKVCELIDMQPQVSYSTEFAVKSNDERCTTNDARRTTNDERCTTNDGRCTTHDELKDFRDVIHAKHPQPDPDFEAQPYWQVFQHKHGFQPNLSILDLLFCMGPEAIFYLNMNHKNLTAHEEKPHPMPGSADAGRMPCIDR